MPTKILTTKISSRGQVVIPKELRKDLAEGTPFAVNRKDDAIILKKIKLDTKWDDMDKSLEEIRRKVKKSGIKPKDLPAIIKRVREEIAREQEASKNH